MTGFRRSNSAYQAVVWDADGTMSDLGTLGGSQSYAEAINDSGVVVGWSLTKGKGKNDGPQRAFVWNDGVMVDLNTLMISGPTVTKPRAINNAGQIIAWSGSTSVLLTPQ
ncbi:hypothetical protein GC207_01575 [bacterium]|nr:hypothetical protein [bacterium]